MFCFLVSVNLEFVCCRFDSGNPRIIVVVVLIFVFSPTGFDSWTAHLCAVFPVHVEILNLLRGLDCVFSFFPISSDEFLEFHGFSF